MSISDVIYEGRRRARRRITAAHRDDRVNGSHSRTRIVPSTLLAVASLLAACTTDEGDRAAAPTRSEPAMTARLVDSVRYENELIGVAYLRRVEVRTGPRVDTLAGVLTMHPPVVAGDSAVHGFVYEEDRIVGAFRYTSVLGVERLALPDDFYANSSPAFSPDARHLAYLALDSTGLGRATVATWPDRRIVYRSPPVRLLESDAPVGIFTWSGPERFDLRLALSVAVGGMQRVRGEVGGAVTVDTIRIRPPML